MANAQGIWSRVTDMVRTQLWPLPAIGVALAIGAGIGLGRLDTFADDQMSPTVKAYLFGGDADAARSVLSAIAGSLITVTSLTFSLTVVTLQLASSQFSPRLLRTFTRDRFVQGTLALFLATFVFALTVLRVVRSADEGGDAFVPRFSVTVAFVLALASVFGLVAFLAHLSRVIRVESMLTTVHAEARTTVRRLLPEQAPNDREPLADVPAFASVLVCSRSGFLTGIDEQRLLHSAEAAEVILRVDRIPGASMIAETPVAYGWSLAGRPLSEKQVSQLQSELEDALSVDFERTTVDDATYGLRQLSDVAIKALSPGINDPTTAVHTLSHTAALLCTVVGRDLGPRVLTDDQGRVRVALARPDFATFVGLAVEQPRRYGSRDPAVLSRLLWLLREVAWCTTQQSQREVIRGQLDRTRQVVRDAAFDPEVAQDLHHLGHNVEAALSGRWPSSAMEPTRADRGIATGSSAATGAGPSPRSAQD